MSITEYDNGMIQYGDTAFYMRDGKLYSSASITNGKIELVRPIHGLENAMILGLYPTGFELDEEALLLLPSGQNSGNIRAEYITAVPWVRVREGIEQGYGIKSLRKSFTEQIPKTDDVDGLIEECLRQFEESGQKVRLSVLQNKLNSVSSEEMAAELYVTTFGLSRYDELERKREEAVGHKKGKTGTIIYGLSEDLMQTAAVYFSGHNENRILNGRN